MRSLTTMSSQSEASTLVSVLAGKGITAEIRVDDDVPTIWIIDDSRVDDAREILSRWRADPGSPEFAAAQREGQRNAAAAAQDARRYARRINEARRSYEDAEGPGWVTKGLSSLSVAASAVLLLDLNLPVYEWLALSNVWSSRAFPEVMSGEVWRLFTPVFLHFSWMHLLFDVYWVWMLGHAVEWRKGGGHLLRLSLFIGVFSNVLQGVMVGPRFGGLSGIVFGLAAYLWLKGRFDPSDRIGLDDTTAIILVVFGLAGFTGLLGPIANFAHLGGAIAGALAFGATRLAQRRR